MPYWATSSSHITDNRPNPKVQDERNSFLNLWKDILRDPIMHWVQADKWRSSGINVGLMHLSLARLGRWFQSPWKESDYFESTALRWDATEVGLPLSQ